MKLKLNLVLAFCVMASFAPLLGSARQSRTLQGKWEGALGRAPNQLRIVLNIFQASDGLYLGNLISLDQGGIPIPMENIQLNDEAVHFEVNAVNGVFEGRLSDPTKITGTWTQGGPVRPLEFARTALMPDSAKAPDPSALDATVMNSPFYAHMQPGSLRVKVGEKVRRGKILGLVGNSGNSTEPHLHFQITDGNSGLDSEGLPYSLDSFEVQTGPNAWEVRLPLLNALVRFPEK